MKKYIVLILMISLHSNYLFNSEPIKKSFGRYNTSIPATLQIQAGSQVYTRHIPSTLTKLRIELQKIEATQQKAKTKEEILKLIDQTVQILQILNEKLKNLPTPATQPKK